MQVAEILSDLTSLRVCDPSAALALVSPSPSNSSQNASSQPAAEDDADLKRAKDLIELHYSVKVAYAEQKLDRDLLEARAAVKRATYG